MRLQIAARIIAWLSFVPILFWGLYTNLLLQVKINSVSIALYLIIGIQVSLLIAKLHIASFRLAIMQIFILALSIYFELLYPDANFSNLMPTNISFPLWVFCGSVLATAGWICHKAIIELKNKEH